MAVLCVTGHNVTPGAAVSQVTALADSPPAATGAERKEGAGGALTKMAAVAGAAAGPSQGLSCL